MSLPTLFNFELTICLLSTSDIRHLNRGAPSDLNFLRSDKDGEYCVVFEVKNSFELRGYASLSEFGLSEPIYLPPFTQEKLTS